MAFELEDKKIPSISYVLVDREGIVSLEHLSREWRAARGRRLPGGLMHQDAHHVGGDATGGTRSLRTSTPRSPNTSPISAPRTPSPGPAKRGSPPAWSSPIPPVWSWSPGWAIEY